MRASWLKEAIDEAAVPTNVKLRLASPAGNPDDDVSSISEAEWTEVVRGKLHAVRRDRSHGHVRLRSYAIGGTVAECEGNHYDGIFSHTTDETKIKGYKDVLTLEGEKIGTVDHLDGPDRIRLQ